MQLNFRPVITELYTKQWRIQDFPEGGRERSRGGVNTPNFPENCMKSKEFGRPGGGRASLTPPPRSANAKVHNVLSTTNGKVHIGVTVFNRNCFTFVFVFHLRTTRSHDK